MDTRYTRLKLKMLLLVVVGTLIVGGVALFLLEVVIDGLLQNFGTRAFVWLTMSFFGKTIEESYALYQIYISNNRQAILMVGTMVLMLIAFYIAMGRFTRWLEEIRTATHLVVEESTAPIALPRELKPLTNDLQAIQHQLAAQKEATRQSEARRKDLVAFLAHDLKTPLTSVVGYLTLLDTDPNLDTLARSKYTGIALDKALRLEGLLTEFFDITSMDLDGSVGELVPIQLTLLLEQLNDEFYPLFAEKGLGSTTNIAPQLVIEGNPEKLVRVFENVLRNAVSYSVEGGQVILAAYTKGDWVEVTVTNEGLEIPEEELSQIFQKFYRLDAARSTQTGGAGLGLAIAQEITQRHGGEIHCESNGRFTTFVIQLPWRG